MGSGGNKKIFVLLTLLTLCCVLAALSCVFFGAYPLNPLDVLRVLAGLFLNFVFFWGRLCLYGLSLLLPGLFDPVELYPVITRPDWVGSLPWAIVTEQRLPRIALAFIAGGGLAIAGAVFQALLRNPLATPHTLGVSAGGALGASAGILFGVPAWGVPLVTPVQVFSLAGSLCVVSVIYLLARDRERFSTMRLLLAGVTIALICSAMIMFIRYLVDPEKLVILDRWMMGGLGVIGWDALLSILPLYIPAALLLFAEAGRLNQLVFGEELAAGRGINVRAAQIRIFIAGSALTSAVVSVAGPIGFVGLIVPHAMRLFVGPDHRLLMPVSFLAGGAFLSVADTAARTLFAPSELPVGVLTAMLGGPFFLYLLMSRRHGI